MNVLSTVIAMILVAASAGAKAQTASAERRLPSAEDVRAVAPVLATYSKDLDRTVWDRAGLNRRDRSLVTLAVMIARGQTAALHDHVLLALDHGVTPKEISETVVQLAFYSGFANAWAAIVPVREAFRKRGVGADQVPTISAAPLPLNEAAEADRARRVSESFDEVSPSLVRDTTNFLFKDLWLRPDLAPRDRSLVTVSSLIANGQVGQVEYHLGRAMDNGLTRAQAGELISHIAFYAGWPSAFSALPIVKTVLDARPKE